MQTGDSRSLDSITGTVVSTRSPHIGHSNHLCDMVEKGQVSLAQIKSLVKDPNFICKKCGRVANSSDNLCEQAELNPPVEVKSATPAGAAPAMPAEVSAAVKEVKETVEDTVHEP